MCSGLGWEGIYPSLNHQMRDVEIHGGLNDFALFNPVELAIPQKRHFTSRGYPEPGLIEQPHQMPHGDHPCRLKPIHLILTGKEDIHAPLHTGEGGTQWLPKALGHCLS